MKEKLKVIVIIALAICFVAIIATSLSACNAKQDLMRCVNSTDATDFSCDSCYVVVYGINPN